MAASSGVYVNADGRTYVSTSSVIPAYTPLHRSAVTAAARATGAERVGDTISPTPPAYSGEMTVMDYEGHPFDPGDEAFDLLVIYGQKGCLATIESARRAILIEGAHADNRAWSPPSAMNTGERAQMTSVYSFTADRIVDIEMPRRMAAEAVTGSTFVASAISGPSLCLLAVTDNGDGTHGLAVVRSEGDAWRSAAMGDFPAATNYAMVAVRGGLIIARDGVLHQVMLTPYSVTMRSLFPAGSGACTLLRRSQNTLVAYADGDLYTVGRDAQPHFAFTLPGMSGAVYGEADSDGVLWASGASRLVLFDGSGRQTPLTRPGGKSPIHVRAGLGSRMLAYTADGSVYYSDDAGYSWALRYTFPDNLRFVGYASRSIIYAVTDAGGEDGVWVSVDGGTTWLEIEVGVGMSLLTALCLPSGGLLVAGRGGDGGVAPGAVGGAATFPFVLTKQAIAAQPPL